MKPGSKNLATLAIDIGGSQIKAAVLDSSGRMMVPEIRLRTPLRATPPAMLRAIRDLAGQMPSFDRISVGFPGYVAKGRVVTAPNLGTAWWRDFPLAETLSKNLGAPARVLNDADVQGLGAIKGRGLECVLTLGTGFGSALFKSGVLLPHLELGQHPLHKNKTYDEYLGNAALTKKGIAKWNRRVQWAIGIVHTLVNYDRLYIGGGNAAAIRFELPREAKIVPNSAGITGGIRLWDAALDELFGEVEPMRSSRPQAARSEEATNGRRGRLLPA